MYEPQSLTIKDLNKISLISIMSTAYASEYRVSEYCVSDKKVTVIVQLNIDNIFNHTTYLMYCGKVIRDTITIEMKTITI